MPTRDLALTGRWLMKDTPWREGDGASFCSPDLDASEWLEVDVPCDVHAALAQAGKLPDPYFGDNPSECAWVTEHDWYFRKTFVPEDAFCSGHTVLELDGVDVYGHVWLNGRKIGMTDNAFMPWRFSVGEILKPGEENVLLVGIESVRERLRREVGEDLRDARTRVRKPQYTFGWDWAPQLPSVSIGLSVRLVKKDDFQIRDVFARTYVDGRVDVFIELNDQVEDGTIEVEVAGNGFAEERSVAAGGHARFHVSFQIPKPRLWWPLGYGEQPLYDCRVRLLHDGGTNDEKHFLFGIREVSTFEEPFEPDGMSFGFKVNGEKILIKGANWIPAEVFPAEVTDDEVVRWVERAAEANLNMLRVWGGGIYERDAFYDACDRLGVLVWQDFMFASAFYSVEEPSFRWSVIREAQHQVRRLRSRPCIAIWCGTNEDRKSWTYKGAQGDELGIGLWSESAAEKSDGEESQHTMPPPNNSEMEDLLYSMVLRGIVSRFSPDTPYVESSPQSHEDFGNDPRSGNSHLSCHKYCMDADANEYRKHFEQVIAFDSEFCVQGPARASSLKRFLPLEHLWPPDDLWTSHIGRAHRGIPHHELHLKFGRELFGPVNSFEDYCKYAAAMHAEFVRAEYEAARRDKFSSGGTMVWMFNDCWPTNNWSFIDYYDVPKPAFYAAKRACRPVTGIVFPRRGMIEFFVSNDTLREYHAVVRWGEEELSGAEVWSKSAEIRLQPNVLVKLDAVSEDESLNRDKTTYMFVDVECDGEKLPRSPYFPKLWKDADWPEPEVKVEIVEQTRDDGAFLTDVRVSCKAYARFLHLDVLPLGNCRFSDNFFDLCAGKSRVVRIRSQEALSKGDILVGHWLTEWR